MNEYLLNTRAKMLKEDFEDTKRIIKIRKSKKDRQHNDQKTDNTMTKRQTIQWPKDRQHNGQKKKDTRTINDLQNITHTIKK